MADDQENLDNDFRFFKICCHVTFATTNCNSVLSFYFRRKQTIDAFRNVMPSRSGSSCTRQGGPKQPNIRGARQSGKPETPHWENPFLCSSQQLPTQSQSQTLECFFDLTQPHQWPSTALTAKLLRNYRDERTQSGVAFGAKVPGHSKEMTQILIVRLFKKHLFSLLRKWGPGPLSLPCETHCTSRGTLHPDQTVNYSWLWFSAIIFCCSVYWSCTTKNRRMQISPNIHVTVTHEE